MEAGDRRKATIRDPQTTAAERLRQATHDRDDDPEEHLWEGGYSGKAMIGHAILAAILTVVVGIAAVAALGPVGFLVLLGVAAIIWAGLGLLLLYRKLNVAYQLTSQRFVHRNGILRQITDRIEVIDMDDVTYEQGLIERLVGVGTIRVSSSDRSHPELVLAGIDEVQRIAGLIDDVRRAERRRRGVHIETI